jgi:hypothetical protein
MQRIDHDTATLRSDQEVPERQVFAAEDRRRERWLRIAGRTGAVLAAVWLAALLGSVLGFSGMPRLPGTKAPADRPDHSAKAAHLRPTGDLASRSNVSGAAAADDAAKDTGRPTGAPGTHDAPAATGRQRTEPSPAFAPPTPAPRQVLASPLHGRPASPGRPQGRAVRRHGTAVASPPPPRRRTGQTHARPGQVKKQTLPPSAPKSGSKADPAGPTG